MKWIKRIIIGLTTAFLAVSCGALLLFNLHSLGWQTLDVPTGSMRPTMPPGSLVLVHRVPLTSLKVGDVITYTNPLTMKSTITHRIIKAYKIGGKVPAFVTKGDANPSADLPVVGGLVKGKAMWHVPQLGSALVWSKTWFGLAVLLYLPALLLMIEEVQRLAAYLRELQPYRLFGYSREIADKPMGLGRKLAASALVSVLLLAGSVAVAFPVHALLASNTIALANNRLSVAATTPGTTCSSKNNVNISSSNNQRSSSGNVSNTGNTTGGSATSGSTSNSNTTNVNITITNCH